MRFDTNEFEMLLRFTNLNHRAYSGRGMYGKSCIGIIADSESTVYAELVRCVPDFVDSHDLDFREVLEELSVVIDSARTDNMGRSDIVVYFPCFTVLDTADEYEDEE